MLENLRMQEVSQIVLSVPVGAVIPGKNYSVGEPIIFDDERTASGFLTWWIKTLSESINS